MFRLEKVNILIQKELGNIILKEIDIFPGILVTITRVECSSSLFNCKVFVSVVPEDKIDEVLALLKRHIYDIQQLLNKKLRMRPVPKIEFLKEKKTSEAARIDELLWQIKKEEGTEGEDIEKSE